MKAMGIARILVAAVLVAGCTSTNKAGDTVSTPTPAGWTLHMRNLSESMATLLPLTLDPMQYNDPRNQAIIEQEMTRLEQFSHSVGDMKNKPSDDPAMEAVAKQFSADMSEAKKQFRAGNRSYSRFLIRNATNYCVSCHTQTARGPQFFYQPESNAFARLSPLDKAQYLIAVRNYDEALKQYEVAMNSSEVALQPYMTLENTTLKALAVAVRVKKDPKLADGILTRMIQSKWAPVYLQLSALQWRTSLQEWQKQSKEPKTLADAKNLVSRGWKKQTETPLSRAGTVEFLRASAVLHELLAEKRPGKMYAETLYYAGLSSEALKDLDLYNLSEHYYEACVRHLPHSDTARNCYLRLEGVTIANYSQFETVPLPASVRERLDGLKRLAEPNDKSWIDGSDRR